MPLGPTRKGVFAALMLCVSAGAPSLGGKSAEWETRLARVKSLQEDRQPAEALVILEGILRSYPPTEKTETVAAATAQRHQGRELFGKYS
jgi:hypothetical protein